MAEPIDPRFGEAVKKRRMAMGLTQEDVFERSHYSDMSAYRRVENAVRKADRKRAVAILVLGLQLSDLTEINSFLALGGYQGMSAGELEDLKVFGAPARGASNRPSEQSPLDDTVEKRRAHREIAVAAGALAATLVVSSFMASTTEYGVGLCFLVSVMYAGLYVISLWLESAYEPENRRLSVTVLIFSLMMLTSVVAMAFDAHSVTSSSDNGLGGALAILGGAAILQGIISNSVLPNYAVVKGRFQMHTARAAHLKNTGHFLLLVVLFWIPPLHAISVLRREFHLGHVAFVRASLTHWILLGRGMICLHFGLLFAALIAIIGISLPMRTQLLDNLRPSPHQDSYLHLFYARAFVYFVLSGICLVWYTYSVGSILDPLGQGG